MELVDIVLSKGDTIFHICNQAVLSEVGVTPFLPHFTYSHEAEWSKLRDQIHLEKFCNKEPLGQARNGYQ